MICYLDASALVKRYVAELGSDEVETMISDAEAVGTVMVTRVEVTAAFAKAARFGALTLEDAEEARKTFHREWSDLVRLYVTEFMMERAALLAWDQGLRAYDAVQLAAAVTWKEAVDEAVAMMSFDQKLWAASAQVGLDAWPPDLPDLIESWKERERPAE